MWISENQYKQPETPKQLEHKTFLKTSIFIKFLKTQICAFGLFRNN